MVGGFGRMGVRFGGMGGVPGGGVSDTTAPTLTLPLALPLGDTSGYLGVTTNEANGTLYYVVTTSATPPSAAQVKAGQNDGGTAAVYAGSQAVSATGALSATATGLSSNTAYYAYFMHEDAAANRSSVSAASAFTTLTTGTSDTDFDNLIAAASVALTDLRKGYVARFIGALYAGSLWSKIDAMWVLAAHDEQFGRLNWKSPGSFTLTAVNSPSFTTDRGFAGNASTSLLDTGWDAATNGVQYTRDDGHISVYAIQSGNAALFGIQTSYNCSVVPNTGTLTRGRVNASADVSSSTSGGSAPFMALVRRNGASSTGVVRDGASVGTGTNASVALSSTDLAFGRVGTAYTNLRCAGGSIGAYFDDTESLAFYNVWHDFMVAVGADT